MRALLIILVATCVAQVSAIQVECRQCHILRQNEEYFEQAKQVVNRRHECAPMNAVSPASLDTGVVPSDTDYEEDIAPEAPLVENAASTGTFAVRTSSVLHLLEGRIFACSFNSIPSAHHSFVHSICPSTGSRRKL